MRLLPLLATAVLVILAPAASAHCAALPRPQDTRLLEDYGDECKVSGGANDCHGADELIALDVQEKWDAGRGADMVVFRLLADKGTAGAKTDTLTVSGASYKWSTSDDHSFTSAGGFDSVSGAQGTGDGSRFYVEGTVPLAKLGKVGDALSGLKVESQSSGSTGDTMPGGCRNTALDCAPPVGDSCYYNPTTAYHLQGSGHYADLKPEALGDVAEGGERIVQFDVVGKVDMSQSVTLTASADDGVTARFHDPSAPSGQGYSDSLHVTLGAKQTYGAHLAVTGLREGAHGVITVTLDTDAGGHKTAAVAFNVVAAGTVPSSSTTTHGTSSRGAVGLDLPVLFLAFAALAMTRRSQR